MSKVINVPIEFGRIIREQVDKYRKAHNLEEPDEVKKFYNKQDRFLEEELDYITSFEIKDDLTRECVRYLRNLKNLTIRNMSRFTLQELINIGRNNPNLASLCLQNVESLKNINLRSFKNLEFLSLVSNGNLSKIEGLDELENIVGVEIFDNLGLTSKASSQQLCETLLRMLKSSSEFNLDVLMYPEMQNAILQHNNEVERGEILGEEITLKMQDDLFKWSEMINRQYDYTNRKYKKEQKCTYKGNVMRSIDKKADEIIESFLEIEDTDEEKYTILYDYLKENIVYDSACLIQEDRMEFHVDKLNSNGMGKGFLKRNLCMRRLF